VAAYGVPAEYYYFDKNGFRFIVLNENYYRYEGEDVAYSEGNYYKFGPYRDVISRPQVKWLEETVMSSPYPMVLFSHGSLMLEGAGAIKNREEVQDIFRRAHKNGKRILMCLNGHYHIDYMRIYEHVCYLDINSASMYWLTPPHHLFPDEFHEKYFGAQSLLIYNDPVHAVITLSEDGHFEIEGMQSSFFHGVDGKAAIVALTTLAVIVLFSLFRHKFLKNAAIIVGMAVGCAVFFAINGVPDQYFENVEWFMKPRGHLPLFSPPI
jgi:hypothetical protein